MIRWLVWVWLLLLPISALAQPVQVTSGEHDGFTRLVLDYGTQVDWQIGRTTDGYEVRLAGVDPAYDLTGVYDPIGRGRLASVWADPETGALRIGIGCACHAQPFEFRPGIVVIDLKDGPPPKGSSFEQALDGGNLPSLADHPPPRPRLRPDQGTTTTKAGSGSYDWTRIALGEESAQDDQEVATTEEDPAPAEALPETDPGLQPLRDVLLQQLSRGAAQGVVEMAHPEPLNDSEDEAASVKVRLNDLPGVRIDDDGKTPVGMTAEGGTCIADDALMIQDWGDERPVVEQMAEATTGLMGEFDTPDPEAQGRAVRFLLHIGFGAEARQILTQMPAALPDASILSSIAHILDDSRDPAPAFAGMAACDTSAALWAILGNPGPEPGRAFDRAAALRSFSALSLTLRRHLGPRLADRFVSLNDAAAADAVRDAILRAPGDAGPEVVLMEARLEMDAGEPAQAEHRIEPLIADSGPATPEALVALVEARLAQREPITPDQITALEGMLHERRNGPDAARFANALTLARALAGDFDGAFADLAESSDAAPDVWSLLAEVGPDSALLTHAVLDEEAHVLLPPEVATRLARRLSDLGFSDAARRWLDPEGTREPDLVARVALQQKDARTALRLVETSEDPAMLTLRAEALRQLGDEAALAGVYAAAGDEEARWRAVGRARDWSQLATAGPAPWQPVAAVATGQSETAPSEEVGPLARGEALLQDSEATRKAVSDLLTGIAAPERSGP